MDDTLLRMFIAVTTIAVAVQAGLLVGLYVAVRKITVMSTNFAESSDLIRNQLGRLDATVTDALDRARLQVIRADELLNRTMDKVEETSEVVHKTVISPLRQVNGLMAAISTGVDVFLGQKRRHPRNGGGVPQDEMFI